MEDAGKFSIEKPTMNLRINAGILEQQFEIVEYVKHVAVSSTLIFKEIPRFEKEQRP